MSDLKNYFMKPTNIEGIGDIHPIRLGEIEKFNKLSPKYLAVGRKYLTNIFKYPQKDYMLDFFVFNAYIIGELEKAINDDRCTTEEKMEFEARLNVLNANPQNKYSINEMTELFSMTLNKEVTFELYGVSEDNTIDYVFKIEDNNSITKYNFEEYRSIVMAQNIIFEPLTSPSKEGNDIIQNAIEVLNKNSGKFDLQSVCSVVSVYKGISDTELYGYTYYRLMMDFETINRINGNMFSAIFMSVGSKDAEIVNLAEYIDLDNNPYKGLISKYKASNLDKRLSKG